MIFSSFFAITSFLISYISTSSMSTWLHSLTGYCTVVYFSLRILTSSVFSLVFQPQACEFCPKQFDTRLKMYWHLKKVHQQPRKPCKWNGCSLAFVIFIISVLYLLTGLLTTVVYVWVPADVNACAAFF
jgi:hypothetical protein